MTPTFDQILISSVKEYVDHRIASKLGAWKNATVPLFVDTKDTRRASFAKIGSGPRQWLYDSAISGANIADPSQFSNPAWQNAITDFKNSRFLLASGSATGVTPTGANVALKHFNSYVSSRDDEDLFQNTEWNFPPEVTSQTYATIADSYYAPCYFIKVSHTKNEGFAMGGLDKTLFNLKITCFAKTEGELLGIASILRDMQNTSTYILSSTSLNEYNDLKTRPWSFHEKLNEARSAGNSMIYIDETWFNPIKSDNINSKMKNIYIGLANMAVFVTRYSRQ